MRRAFMSGPGGGGGSVVVPVCFAADYTVVNPLDSQDYFFGGLSWQVSEVSKRSQYVMPAGCVVLGMWGAFDVDGTLGSAELVAFTLRVNGVDTALSASVAWNVARPVYSAQGLVSVSEGDEFTLHVVTPAWVTNPTSVRQAQFGLKVQV